LRLRKLLDDDALLANPGTLALTDVEWGGCPVGLLELVVESDGTLSLDAQPPSNSAICQDPEKWSPELLKGRTKFGPLRVDKGACWTSRISFHVDAGSRMEAHLQGWRWSAIETASDSWWAGSVAFASKKAPTLWFRPTGNVLVVAAGFLHRLWRVELPSGRQAFFGARHDRWFVLLQSEPGRVPSTPEVGDLIAAVSFVLGEPIALDLLFQIAASGEIVGMARLDLARPPTPSSSQSPALPFMVEPEWLVRFVERALVFMAANPGGIVHVAMHCYLWGLLGTIDMRFLQAWVGTEALAGWMLRSRMVSGPPGALLVGDVEAWRQWVVKHQAEITAFSAIGSGDRLFQKVMSAAAKATSKVEKVFIASGLPWTEEMDDVQDIRNVVAHAAVIAPIADRDWRRDRRRVGLMQTMLVALLARVIDYDGPIADRSETCFTPTGNDRPGWWSSDTLEVVTDHWGRDIPGSDNEASR